MQKNIADASGSKEKNCDKATCIACLETIIPGASICPHCHTSQRRKPWITISGTLKLVGGITAILSLFIIINQTNNLLEKWTNTQKAVNQRVASARLQSEIGDYSGAFQQLKQALALDPSSPEANRFEVELAMSQLRNINAIAASKRPLAQYNSTKNYQLSLILYRGAVSASTPQEKATILAHLGWLNILRQRSGTNGLDIDFHFKEALEIDPDNFYANVMWATWLPDGNYKAKHKEDLPLSRKLFKKALQNQKDRRYVRELQLAAYSSYNFELLRIGHEMYETGEFQDIQPYPIQTFIQSSCQELYCQKNWEELTDNFTLEKILTFTEWLLAEYPSLDNESTSWGGYAYKESLYYAQARLFFDLGDYQHSLEALQKAQSLFIARIKYGNTLYATPEISGLTENRLASLAKKQGLELAPILISYGGSHQSSAKESGLKNGDAILFLNGKPLHSETEYDESNIAKGMMTAKILRAGKLVEIEFSAAENGINTRQILAPVTLWKSAISSETALAELYRVWINPHKTILPDAE